MAKLILVRHGKSEWNALGLWTGWTDINLTEEGRAEARRAGEAIRDIELHGAYVSPLIRAQQTLQEIQDTLELKDLPVRQHQELTERHYGIYTGKNKWELKESLGDDEFLRIRRGWDVPIPEGESLRQVYDRAIPFYQENILPELKDGKNILAVGHGNTFRALMKYLEEVDDDKIHEVEIETGEIVCYDIDTEGKVVTKERRARS